MRLAFRIEPIDARCDRRLQSGWHTDPDNLLHRYVWNPNTLAALTVNVDDADTRALLARWEKLNIDIPLKVIESPYREITRPVVDYIKRLRKSCRATSSTCISPNTSSVGGGKTCCTTKVRCGSRHGCCSNLLLSSPACRGSSVPPSAAISRVPNTEPVTSATASTVPLQIREVGFAAPFAAHRELERWNPSAVAPPVGFHRRLRISPWRSSWHLESSC